MMRLVFTLQELMQKLHPFSLLHGADFDSIREVVCLRLNIVLAPDLGFENFDVE